MRKIECKELLSLIDNPKLDTRKIKIVCENRDTCNNPRSRPCSFKNNKYSLDALISHLKYIGKYSIYFREGFIDGSKIFLNFKCTIFTTSFIVKTYIDANIIEQYQLNLFKGDSK
uniref:Uncharacterized protein n=1 Tax=viral metagenome TaxID=1070528 RepID=A0A6H1ZR01_9ZZZZ